MCSLITETEMFILVDKRFFNINNKLDLRGVMENKEILDSWKDISQYLNRDIRTCSRWEKKLRLPIHRIDNKSSRSKVFAFKSEIDQWLEKKAKSEEIDKKQFLKNRWVIIGSISCLILLSAFFAFLYFTQSITSLPFSKDITIAVLSFENLNSSKYDEYLSEGITKELINTLTTMNKLKVMPTPTTFRYKNINVKQLRKKLEVDYVLEGKMEKIGNNIKMIVQLIKAKNNTIIWDGKFEEALENISSIPNNICLKISEILNLNHAQNFTFNDEKNLDYLAFDNYLKGNYILKRLNETNRDPWKLYHQGKYYWEKRTPDANELAINLFNKAIEIDNNFAPPYLGIAQCYINYVNYNWDFNKKWIDKAEILVEKAQTITPDLPEYYSILIQINLTKELGFNIDTQSIAFELAQEGLKKYPNHPQLNSIVGYCYYFKFGEKGKEADFNKAIEYKEKSFLLNPYDLHNIVYTELLMLNKDFYKAIEVCNIIEKHDYSQMVKFRLGEIHYYMGDLEKSQAIFQQFEAPLEFKMVALFYLGMIASQKGEKEKAQKILQKTNFMAPESLENKLKLASIYMGLGEKESGYKCLESFYGKTGAKKRRFIYHKYIDIDNNFDRFKEEENFKKIIKFTE